MILCDFCNRRIDKADEHDLVVYVKFKEAGLRIRAAIESASGPPIRHICPKCKFKILDRTMKFPLADVPTFEVKVRRNAD